MIRRRVVASRPELDASVVVICLRGWTARPADGTDATSNAFTLFQERAAGVVQRWREHEAFLRSEATRLRIAPGFGPGGRYYFGESLARRATRMRP
jgi:hypothetical protein